MKSDKCKSEKVNVLDVLVVADGTRWDFSSCHNSRRLCGPSGEKVWQCFLIFKLLFMICGGLLGRITVDLGNVVFVELTNVLHILQKRHLGKRSPDEPQR